MFGDIGGGMSGEPIDLVKHSAEAGSFHSKVAYDRISMIGDDERNVDKATGKGGKINSHGRIDVGVKDITAVASKGRDESGDEGIAEGSGDGIESVDVNTFQVLIGRESGDVCRVDFYFVSGID